MFSEKKQIEDKLLIKILVNLPFSFQPDTITEQNKVEACGLGPGV